VSCNYAHDYDDLAPIPHRLEAIFSAVCALAEKLTKERMTVEKRSQKAIRQKCKVGM
jgi:hypothetical protein